ncbi:MAG: alpha-amylase family glycosyl hydrolase, partial [Bacteroidales bacterium]|nr:alpha-amylase family glycosyl hydrolase [Bacteroidales bacterium]
MKKMLTFFLAFLLLLSCSKGEVPPGPQPPAVVRDDISQYDSRSWDGVKRGGIFYEIFVRSFADGNNDGIGDIKGITAKLDYLNELGVSGIWLTPIHPSPSYHGYDVDDYKAIKAEYGT